MENISDEFKRAIQTAIDLEKEGMQFYKMAEENTQDKMGRKMFNFLALEEVNHMKIFSEIFDDITGSKEWRKIVREDDQRIKNSPIIKKLKESYENNKEKGEIEALSIAMELERRAIDFFKDAEIKSKDKKSKDAFAKIHLEEETHYDLLQAQLDSVNNSGFWFDVAEFKMDGRY
jgi:rubrerythrin